MRKILSLSFALLAMLLISCGDKEDPAPQKKNYEVELSELTTLSTDLNSAEFSVSIRYADKAAYVAIPLADASQADAKIIINNGTEILLDPAIMWDEQRSEATDFKVEGLESDTEYRLFVAAMNNTSQSYKLEQIDFRTAAEPTPEPEKELKLSLTASEATDYALSFIISSENAEQLAWYVKTDITDEALTPEYILEIGAAATEEEINTEFLAVWQNDLQPESTYLVYAAACDSKGNTLMKSIKMTTLKSDVIETIAYSGGEAEVVNPDSSDHTTHYLTLENDDYFIGLTLSGSTINGFFSTSGQTNKIDVTNSKIEKKTESGRVELPAFSAADGAINIMQNSISGRWEIEGTLFLEDETMVTIEYDGQIKGIQIDAEKRDTIDIENISASINTDVGNTVWYLEFSDRSGNTVGLSIETYQEIDYIPSGKYFALAAEESTGNKQPYIMVEESWIEYEGVATDIGSQNGKGEQTKLVVEYDQATGESYITATICNGAGTLTLNVKRTGPLNLYGTGPVQVTELVEKNLIIWIYKDSNNPTHWVMDWYGDNTYANTMHFIPETPNSDYLPAGKYYLRSSAPASGNWIDFSAESPSKIGILRGEQLTPLLDSEECYIEITTEMSSGKDQNSITGTIKTADGRYIITMNYSGAFDY